MKARTLLLGLASLALAFTGLARATADTSVAVGISISSSRDFYEPLGPYGYWVDLPNYGRCWYPAYVGSDWRPYGEGHWEWTDQGWYWVSDEPWGWATYHYGRWVLDSYYGWVWVPGTEWGPAWVAWREGGGYVGWAPLPPAYDFAPTGFIVVEHVHWHPRSFVFVEHRHFCGPIRRQHHHVNDIVIINKTVNITKVEKVVNNNTTIIVNNGPSVTEIERTAPRKIERVSAADLWRQRSDRVIERGRREGVKPPPVATLPVGRDRSLAPRVVTTSSAPADLRPDRDRDRDRNVAPGQIRRQENPELPRTPATTRRPEPVIVRPVTPVEPSTPAERKVEPPRRPEPPRTVRPAPPPTPTPPAPPVVERDSNTIADHWQKRVRELREPQERQSQEQRERQAREQRNAPRNENRGNFFEGRGLPAPRQPLPAPTNTGTDSSTDTGKGKGKDRDSRDSDDNSGKGEWRGWNPRRR